jgi:hypothetical protein
MKKYDVATLQAFAAAKGGLLISTKYINANSKLLWECEKGHQWEARWANIKNAGQWCPYCAGKAKPNIIELQQFASSKQGKLISTKYTNAKQALDWECLEGHQWKACWDNIKNAGQWCPYCAGKAKPDISELQLFASNKGGKLLSTEYTNAKQALDWECLEGHQWKASWDNISHGVWCPYCAGKAKPNIIELQQFASSKQGKLISTKYINNNTKLLWECSEGHQWKACWHNIKNAGQWCPECASFKTEYKCKELLEQKFRFGFKKTRFYYDKNNKHKFFEFDGYNAENKVAFEYQGIQHYVYPNFFHKTLEIHENAKQRDLDKINYVKENNIKLIIIPYTENNNLEEYINKQIENITI